MFGMGFGEILLVAIVAIIFLGPEKLPEVMVNIAKFFKSIKRNISDAKDALESEINISEMKQDALEYKNKIEKGASDLYNDAGGNESREIGSIFSDLKSDTKKELDDLPGKKS